MKSAVLTPKPKSYAFWGLVLLAVVLGLLFWKSFLPGYVLFSNDGPLGQQMTVWSRLPQAFLGSWGDLNAIGGNAGALPPDLTTLLRWVLGPVYYAKFSAPIALFILGLGAWTGAWTFFRQLKLTPLAATLGALAAALTSTFFSDACWGTASHQIAFGMDFFALALIVSNSPATPWFVRWTQLALAGLLVGMNVMEAFDIGAIFSLFVAAFTLFHSLVEGGPCPVVKKIGRGIGRTAVIAIFAGFIATQTIVTLVGFSITGITGTAQDEKTKSAHWDFATQWSLPKTETLGLIVPGLFGYRMDTTAGGNYWGAVGRDPALDRFFESGQKGTPPQELMRFSGTGNYAGVLVILLAVWAVAQSLRRKNSVFSETHRRFIWFWTAVLIVSLLLAFGRFAPFNAYALPYKLPYFSTIRNPVKFLFVLSWALVTVFAYGVHGLSRRYLETPSTNANSTTAQLKAWWTKVRGFDRNWTSTCVLALVGSLLAWLIYAMQKPNLISYLKTVGFPDENMAGQIAAFSISQVGWFILFLALAAGLFTLILSGAFAGRRAKWGGILLGALLILDLGRADLPWIIHWDYKQKYEVGSLNPIVNFLRDKSYEHRVAVLPFHLPQQFESFNELYQIEWIQQLFPYYNIQSLDIVQMPRISEDLAAYDNALAFRNVPETVYLIPRRWELTNTRYLLGPAGFLDVLNEQLDPAQRRFRIVQRFSVVLKPGVEEFHQRPEELTAVPNDNGDYALFEFTGALPRAKLYSNWQVNTNDTATLKTLASTNFNAWQTVLVSTPLPTTPTVNATNGNSGTVEFRSYAPKDIVFSTRADTPTVLLLNDRFDPHWRVLVDGRPAPLLRCNFIMRGVYLTPGAHMVEFQFKLPNGPLYVSLTAIGVGILLAGWLFLSTRRNTNLNREG
ncbi:MAG: hypothetical protein ABSE97_05785 [Verrucomicrobiota bacterium]|jgi:hypothetical protein